MECPRCLHQNPPGQTCVGACSTRFTADSIVECKRKTARAMRRVLEGQVPAAVANPEVLNRLPWAVAQ
jgi:hypothetical protein